MRNAQGYAIIVDPNAPAKECDTFTCAHCQQVVFVKPRCDPSEMGGFCRLCYKHTCGPCADKGSCDPFEKKLERAEARGQMLRSMGLG